MTHFVFVILPMLTDMSVSAFHLICAYDTMCSITMILLPSTFLPPGQEGFANVVQMLGASLFSLVLLMSLGLQNSSAVLGHLKPRDARLELVHKVQKSGIAAALLLFHGSVAAIQLLRSPAHRFATVTLATWVHMIIACYAAAYLRTRAGWAAVIILSVPAAALLLLSPAARGPLT